MKIPLPKVDRTPNAKSHPFPFRIGIQAQEFIVATVFYWILSDTAAGVLFRTPGGMEKVKESLMESGRLTEHRWQEQWKHLGTYSGAFEPYVLQSVVIFIFSHWDWYIRQLRNFVLFAIAQTPDIQLDKKLERQLRRIDYLEVSMQLIVLEQACQVTLQLDEDTRSAIAEMSLARNIGLHNRWEVDKYYLDNTRVSGLSHGDLRVVTKEELNSWANSVSLAINLTCNEIGKRFVHVVDYPPVEGKHK
jgi:hypothetical protein